MAQHLPPDAPPASSADCALIRTHLGAFVDDELTALHEYDRSLGSVVGGHLQACASCAREAQHVSALRAAVRAVGVRERETVRAGDALRRRAARILSSR